MKKLYNGFIMSLSMFSTIPTPQVWDTQAMCLVGPMLPMVGAIIGLIWYGMACFLESTSIGIALNAAIIMLVPLVLSGFIHMDGYMDACDACFSRADMQKKHAILKDSNVGAFAVIAALVYFILAYGALCGILESGKPLFSLLFIPVMSRGVSAIALLNTKPISDRGFGASFKQGTKPGHKAALILQVLVCACAGYFLGGVTTLYVLSWLGIGGCAAWAYATKQLDGISGDVCGFISTLSELTALICWSCMA